MIPCNKSIFSKHKFVILLFNHEYILGGYVLKLYLSKQVSCNGLQIMEFLSGSKVVTLTWKEFSILNFHLKQLSLKKYSLTLAF